MLLTGATAGLVGWVHMLELADLNSKKVGCTCFMQITEASLFGREPWRVEQLAPAQPGQLAELALTQGALTTAALRSASGAHG